MSDGMSDSRKEEHTTRRLRSAVSMVVDALGDVTDAALGVPPGALDVLNEELRQVGLKIVRVRQ